MSYVEYKSSGTVWHASCNREGRTKLMSFGSKLKNFNWRKKMKNVLTTITLAATLAFGSTFAFADGIIVGDRTEGIIVGDQATVCSETKEGIIVGDFVTWIEGIIVGDSSDSDCSAKEGILVSDRTEGIIVGD